MTAIHSAFHRGEVYVTEQKLHTAKYRAKSVNGKYVFTFLCASSGAAVCTAKPVQAVNEQEALAIAWDEEGRGHFNKCRKCGAWVSDMMYNADTLKCVDCSPWEEKPHFCAMCGREVEEDEIFCKRCGTRLQYGGE